jgi:hypothetical protein
MKFVMPVKTGIQVRVKRKNRLDSGVRRNDGNQNRFSVNQLRTFGLKPRSFTS